MMFITRGVEGRPKAEKIRRKIGKLREAKARTLRRVLIARSCGRLGGKGRGGKG